MTQTLNDTQRKLVEDNHNLIYSFLQSRNLSLDSVNDWYGTAAIGLCKAAMAFDESRGTKFTTLAYICIDNEVRQTIRDSRKSITPVVSLDDEISTEDDGYCYADVIPDDREVFYSVYLNDAINIAMRGLSDKDKSIIDLKINGELTQIEIAVKFGISQASVSRAYGSFLKKIRRCFND